MSERLQLIDSERDEHSVWGRYTLQQSDGEKRRSPGAGVSQWGEQWNRVPTLYIWETVTTFLRVLCLCREG